MARELFEIPIPQLGPHVYVIPDALGAPLITAEEREATDSLLVMYGSIWNASSYYSLSMTLMQQRVIQKWSAYYYLTLPINECVRLWNAQDEDMKEQQSKGKV